MREMHEVVDCEVVQKSESVCEAVRSIPVTVAVLPKAKLVCPVMVSLPCTSSAPVAPVVWVIMSASNSQAILVELAARLTAEVVNKAVEPSFKLSVKVPGVVPALTNPRALAVIQRPAVFNSAAGNVKDCNTVCDVVPETVTGVTLALFVFEKKRADCANIIFPVPVVPFERLEAASCAHDEREVRQHK